MNEIQNPYGEVPSSIAPRNTVMDVESNRMVAEVQGMVLMAKKFPRDPVRAMENILIECQRSGLAEVALYSYSRGGTDISGASIRLAEVIQRNWGNMEASVVELSQSNGQSEMMSYCWDIEKNVRNTKIFTVKHERYTKKGTYALSDPRDVYENNSNLAARRLRAVILATVPGDIVEAAVQQCEATLKSKADTSPEAMKKMVEAFGQYNVTKHQIEKRIQRKLDSITPAQLIALRKIFNSLKDGMSSQADWFEQDQSASGSSKKPGVDELKAKLRSKKEKDPPPVAEATTETEMPEFGEEDIVVCPYTKDPIVHDLCGTCQVKDHCDVAAC